MLVNPKTSCIFYRIIVSMNVVMYNETITRSIAQPTSEALEENRRMQLECLRKIVRNISLRLKLNYRRYECLQYVNRITDKQNEVHLLCFGNISYVRYLFMFCKLPSSTKRLYTNFQQMCRKFPNVRCVLRN